MTKRWQCVILDVDGTLIDSNDAHALAWVQAMSEQGHHVPFNRVRPLIGMGGDKVLPETLSIAKESPEGLQISNCRKEIFSAQYLPNLHAVPQARELLQCLHEQGLKLVVATSAEPDELAHLLQLLGPHAFELFEQEASAKDAQRSKPDPDVMQAALKRAGVQANEAIMLGDTAYDITSASQAGVQTIAFRCGGWSDRDLQGAIAIYDGPADLLAHFATSPLAGR